MVLFYFPPPKNRDPTHSAQKENKGKKHTTYVPVNPGFTAWNWSLKASTLHGQVRWAYIKTESEMGVGYAQMCIKTAVYVNQENLDQGSLLALS